MLVPLKRHQSEGGSEPSLQNKNITENGVYSADAGYDGLGIVNVSVAGGSQIDENLDVLFLGADGKPVYGFTKKDFLKLTEMPPIPEYNDLIPQEWNWSLEGAKAYVSKNGECVIGAQYETPSGGLEVIIDVPEALVQSPIRFSFCVNGTATVDFGDGNITTISGTRYVVSTKNVQNTYAKAGTYRVKIYGAELGLCGISSYGALIVNYLTSSAQLGYNYYSSIVREMYIGSDVVAVGTSYNLANLRNCDVITFSKNSLTGVFTEPIYIVAIPPYGISLPRSNTELKIIIQTNRNLKFVSFPEGYVAPATGQFVINTNDMLARLCIDSLPGANALNVGNAFRLKRLVAPINIDTIASSGVKYCFSLEYFKAEGDIVRIDGSAFEGCGVCGIFDFTNCTTVPVLGTNAFRYTSDIKRILVPSALYDEWIAATNWSTIASFIEAV